jgi:hypothetical protein
MLVLLQIGQLGGGGGQVGRKAQATKMRMHLKDGTW